MKHRKSFAIIMGVTLLGELLHKLIPLPIPASIYGLVILFCLLAGNVVKLETVQKTGEFLIEIMPLMFIPAAAGLLNAWDQLEPVLFPVIVITLVSTVGVMVITGKTADYLLKKRK